MQVIGAVPEKLEMRTSSLGIIEESFADQVGSKAYKCYLISIYKGNVCNREKYMEYMYRVNKMSERVKRLRTFTEEELNHPDVLTATWLLRTEEELNHPDVLTATLFWNAKDPKVLIPFLTIVILKRANNRLNIFQSNKYIFSFKI